MPTHEAKLVLRFGYGPSVGIAQTVTGNFGNLSHVCSRFHPDGVTWTHPKEEGFKHYVEVERVEEFPSGLLARITVGDTPDLVNTQMELSPPRRNGSGVARLDLEVNGPLSAIETNNLHALRQGYRSRTVEDLYAKVAAFAWSQLDGLYLRGGVAYDQPVDSDRRDVYLVINSKTGVGKTALLLRALQEGMQFVSNRALLRFEQARDGPRRLSIIPQYMPLPLKSKPGRRIEAPVRIMRAMYAELRDKKFDPTMPGVREYTEEDSPEVGRDAVVLGITSPTNPVPLDEKTRLIIVIPELSQVSGIDVARIPKPDWAGNVRNVWRSGWSLEDTVEGLNMFEALNVTPDSRVQVMAEQEKFARDFVRPGIFEDVASRASAVLRVHYGAADIDRVFDAIKHKVAETEEE